VREFIVFKILSGKKPENCIFVTRAPSCGTSGWQSG
jgi:hypothetical protein